MDCVDDEWAARIRAGDIRAVSRAITAIENHDPAADDLLEHLFPATGRAYIDRHHGRAGHGQKHAGRPARGALSGSRAGR